MSNKHWTTVFIVLAVAIHCSKQGLGQENPLPKKTPTTDKREPIVQDTIPKKNALILKDSLLFSTNSDLDAPIDYSADDSIVFDVESNIMHIYKKGVLKYKDLQLDANKIAMNSKTSILHAEGLPNDTTQDMEGLPVFKQGDQNLTGNTMDYNFKTQKAKMKQAVTQQGEGYLIGQESKMENKETIFIKDAMFTTCSQTDHPHFGLHITRGKLVTNKRIISSVAYLEIADIPLPVGLPFFYFPITKGQRRGFILPNVRNSQQLGVGLENLGFYLPINDQAALTLTGNIYSLGSWRLGSRLEYIKKYKFNTNLQVTINSFKQGDIEVDKNRSDKDYGIVFGFTLNPKLLRNSSFNANVNYSSSRFAQNTSFQANSFTRSTSQSTINYSKNFVGSPFSLSTSMVVSQNFATKENTFSLPQINVTMQRITPFQNKNGVGKSRWYESIGLSYAINNNNTLRLIEDSIGIKNFNDFARQTVSGISHTATVNQSTKLLKHINFSTGASFNEYWYFKTINRAWNYTKKALVVTDTTNGFRRALDWNVNAGFGAVLYGTYANKLKRGKVAAVRHTLSPDVSFSYRPDRSQMPYFQYLQTDSTGRNKQYFSIFDLVNNISTPQLREFGGVNFGLNNNIQMKLRPKNDTSEAKIIKLIDNLSIRSGYNFIADSLQISPISVSAQTTLSQYSQFSVSSTFNPYRKIDFEKGGSVVVNQLQYNFNKKLARVENLSFSLNTQLSNQEKLKDKTTAKGLKIPYNINIFYTLTYIPVGSSFGFVQSNQRWQQTLGFSGNVRLTDNWNIDFNSGIDIRMKKLVATTINISRDLHCWELYFSWTPFGFQKSYMFTLRPKSGMLRDVKVPYNRFWYDINQPR